MVTKLGAEQFVPGRTHSALTVRVGRVAAKAIEAGRNMSLAAGAVSETAGIEVGARRSSRVHL